MHVNYKRGETRRFVWRREQPGQQCTHYTWHKGKRESARYIKTVISRAERRRAVWRLARGEEVVTRCIRQGEVNWRMS